jgi:unsaturated rhamnogalacturonyl hydrolase
MTSIMTSSALRVTARIPAEKQWSSRTADSILARHPRATSIESGEPPRWSYSPSFAVYAVAQVGLRTGDTRYVDYARQYMDAFVDAHGWIITPTYRPDAFKLDDVAPGRLLILLHARDQDERWLTAARTLAAQLERQPRTADGGFWHKLVYPYQMWLDGIYMACPFMAEFGRVTGELKWVDEAARQILLIARHTRDATTGLYFHGWDECRSERWADPTTGRSPCIWGRAVGWYVMGIIETLEQMPPDHARRPEIVALLRGLAAAVGHAQHPATGVWYQILDQPGRDGNYLESSASCMFTFALAKAARLGHLGAADAAVARRGYDGVLSHFVKTHDAFVDLTDTCQVAGLAGNPYRDGSRQYYLSEPRVTNDPKGVAPFILASLEIEN